MHLIDRDWLMKIFSPVSWSVNEQQFVLEGRKYDPITHYNESWVVIVDEKTGVAKKHFHRVRLYSSDEVLNLMKVVGLQDIQIFGNADGGKFIRGESSHPFYIGRKT